MKRCEGIIIRQTDYREADKIIVLYTKEFGKIGLVAAGAKKANNRLASVTQLFVKGYYSFYPSKNLGSLRQGELLQNFSTIQQDLFLTAYTTFLCELLNKSTEDRQPRPSLYRLFTQIITRIDQGDDPEILTQLFEMKLLPLLGLYPEMEHCTFCSKREGPFDFSTHSNGIICYRCFEKDPYRLHLNKNTVKILRLLTIFQMERLGKINVRQTTKEELRRVIDIYYQEKTGLYLKSKKFLTEMTKWSNIIRKDHKD